MSRKRKIGVDNEYIHESWSRTEQYKVKGRHLWTIDDFMRRAQNTEVGDSLCSPVFSIPVEGFDGDVQNLTFQLEVFPNGEEGEDNSDYVAVFLTSRRQEDLEVKYDFSVLKADNTFWGRIGNTFKKFSPEQNSWGYGKAFSKAKLSEKAYDLLPNGRLTIACNLEIYYSDRCTEGRSLRLENRLDLTPSLGDNLEAFLNNSEFSDVTIVVVSDAANRWAPEPAVGAAVAPPRPPDPVPSTSSSPSSSSLAAVTGSSKGSSPPPPLQPPPLTAIPEAFGTCQSRTPARPRPKCISLAGAVSSVASASAGASPTNEVRFHCHKVVLAARSDVFAAMFSHTNTSEAMSNEIRMTDIEPEVVDLLLQFVYTEKIGNKEALALHAGALLSAADKYNVPRLKAVCEEVMCDTIEVNNAAEMLGLAYLHEAKNLQSVAIDFVININNMEKVADTTGWKAITASQPKIINEVLMAMTLKYKKMGQQ